MTTARTLALLSLVAATVGAGAACGGSVCGNGKVESGEQCDDGNLVAGDGCSPTCQAEPARDTYIDWTFITKQFPGFTGETCGGLGVAKVKLEGSGASTFNQSVDCTNGQIKLAFLPPGSYQVKATALDGGGAPISRGLAHAAFTVSSGLTSVSVEFPFEDWTRSYTGTYYFATRWGGASCADANPPVDRERVRLERDNVTVGGMTNDGLPLDGSATGPCRDDTNGAVQAARDVPWGPARITLTGEDTAGHVLYRKAFDTFVGADISNPSFLYDVASLAPDAGVAAPDAGGP
jgi:cysteine-rich repeat protein